MISCTDCKHCGMDMELEPYCAEPTTVLPLHRWGLYVNHSRMDEKLCGQDARFFKPRTEGSLTVGTGLETQQGRKP